MDLQRRKLPATPRLQHLVPIPTKWRQCAVPIAQTKSAETSSAGWTLWPDLYRVANGDQVRG